MEFVFSQEQQELREAVRRMLTELAPIARNRALAETGERYDARCYRAMAEQIGVQGLALPENLGGGGGSLIDLALVCEEQGAVLLGGPFFGTVVLAAQALLVCQDDPLSQELLAAIGEGERTAALAVLEADGRWDLASLTTHAERVRGGYLLRGTKELVLDGADADELLVVARTDAAAALFRLPPGEHGVHRERLDVLDATRPLARLRLDGAPAQLIGTADAGEQVLRHVHRAGTTMLAAEQVGASRQCVELTTRYARERKQFGRPIGAFQAVKHRLADMASRLELASAAAYWAAWRCAGATSLAGFTSTDAADPMVGATADHAIDEAVAVAGAYCGDAFLRTASDTIQLHGGIGFTWEHDAHLFLRRARADRNVLGSPRQHWVRLGELIGAEGGSR
ncbi:alkylation response protein AidB-like acyl-CoA dehydrogenase [Tamaricihabitans halophyticus]|uniref:Alkylation response protein AidB-like acyl-CoA dehydrogenase n=1 Tax=Tamaricihabitans halophyticus TaxID=1262583 RepID=A0A4R2QM96_9PSEU|nr:acyl-CoA dehydrogenase family protein [Tamaricihabitans halophyticus]TCP49964.1 alkylation response protein AidB-like acyl-CoA dehydrogenase [Tamaricihabitans halophyticus]